MKNKEFYAEAISKIKPRWGVGIGVDKRTNCPKDCYFLCCSDCLLMDKKYRPDGQNCYARFNMWLEEESGQQISTSILNAIKMARLILLNGISEEHFVTSDDGKIRLKQGQYEKFKEEICASFAKLNTDH